MEVEEIQVTSEARIAYARIQNGACADAKHDEPTGRRLAEYNIHDHVFPYSQPSGTAVVTESKVIGICRQKGTLAEICICPEVQPDSAVGGSNRTYTVDIQRSTSGGTFASILTGGTPVTIDNTDANRTPQFFFPTGLTFARGDQIKVVVTTTGSSGTQGQGLTVYVVLRIHGAA